VNDARYWLDSINPFTWFATVSRIRKSSPDVVVLQWWVPFWALAWMTIVWLIRRYTEAKVVFISHNVMPHEASRLDRVLARQVLGLGDVTIVHSEQDHKKLLDLLPRAQVHVAPHPTYRVFAENAPTTGQARRELGLDGETPVILFFGFVRPYKGLQYLIEALPLVLADLDVHLLIAGEFWDGVQRYREQIQSLHLEDHVTLVDEYVSNERVGMYFAGADLVALPYVDATQSGIVQMAFGFGVPVLTTDVGGLGEAVQDGVTGLLVRSRDSQALASAIRRYFKDRLGPGMRANIKADEDRFAWEKMVALIEQSTA
jgi:glycosyltransferase involved in cell wall biosynthesis